MLNIKQLLLPALMIACFSGFAQTCDCEKEFLYIKGFIEHNYAGYKDKLAQMTPAGYARQSQEFQQLSKGRYANEKCLTIISGWLSLFKDDHIQIRSNFDGTKLDTLLANSRQIIDLPAKKLEALGRSTGIEGIYLSRFDSSYRIAVMKDKTLLHDYIGVMIDSKLPYWKRGMVKWESKFVNDSLYRGILYMRNHKPKPEWFAIGKNSIGGDWQREGTQKEKDTYRYEPVASHQLSDKTFYIKISSFDASNAENIDSLFKANQEILSKTPYLVIDVRDNGGGSDFAYGPMLPYLYTQPVKNIGVDVLATDATINGWKEILKDEDIPEKTKTSITNMIAKMEGNKGKLINIVQDETDSSYKRLDYPQKVVILTNRGCASSTEQFLLYARQSTKVILAGEHTGGVLDYSNMRPTAFSCMPYILYYATTRSRRLDIKQGIDNVGIQPNKVLKAGTDWIREAQQLLER
jgi:hypothetical protein